MPVCHRVTSNTILTRKLTRIQRLESIRICSAYGTIPTEGVGVIARLNSIEVLIQEKKRRYEKISSGQHARRCGKISGTLGPIEDGHDGWSRILLSRLSGDTENRLLPYTSSFGIRDERRADTDQCTYCGKTDDVKHTSFTCTKSQEDKDVYKATTGFIFNLESMTGTNCNERGMVKYVQVRKTHHRD